MLLAPLLRAARSLLERKLDEHLVDHVLEHAFVGFVPAVRLLALPSPASPELLRAERPLAPRRTWRSVTDYAMTPDDILRTSWVQLAPSLFARGVRELCLRNAGTPLPGDAGLMDAVGAAPDLCLMPCGLRAVVRTYLRRETAVDRRMLEWFESPERSWHRLFSTPGALAPAHDWVPQCIMSASDVSEWEHAFQFGLSQPPRDIADPSLPGWGVLERTPTSPPHPLRQ